MTERHLLAQGQRRALGIQDPTAIYRGAPPVEQGAKATAVAAEETPSSQPQQFIGTLATRELNELKPWLLAVTLDSSGNTDLGGGSLAAAKITSTEGRVRNTTRKINTDSPYTVLATDEVIFFDTDGGAIEADLPAGVEGTHYKLINCGSSGNDLTVDPNGSEQIYGQGAGVDMILADGDVLDIDYNATEGWW